MQMLELYVSGQSLTTWQPVPARKLVRAHVVKGDENNALNARNQSRRKNPLTPGTFFAHSKFIGLAAE
jgi:hypothetical protein